jgi:molybdopterin-containing oxidoreductase family iron-sulfur binding subunit
MKKAHTDRRSFLKYAGLGLAGASVLPAASALAASAPSGTGRTAHVAEETLTAGRWAMVVDTRRLATEADLEPLIEACHKVHNVPEIHSNQNIKWLWADHFHAVFPEMGTRWPEGRFPEHLEHKEFLLLCNHCENPPCVRVCPTKATFQRDDGIVLMDYHRCIGCRFCMAGCPYGARSFNFQDPRPFLDEEEINQEFPTRTKGVVEKCNFCAERLAEGKQPACVEASDGALIFGDLDDRNSEVSRVLRETFTVRRKPTLGTQPNVYYII